MTKDLNEVMKALGADVDFLVFEEGPDAIGVRGKRFLETTVWRRLNEAIRELGGEYSKKKRGWIVPLEKSALADEQKQEKLVDEDIGSIDLVSPSRNTTSDLGYTDFPKVDAKLEAGEEKAVQEVGGYRLLPLDRLLFPAKKLRQTIDEGYIREVAETVKSMGIIEPILARPKSDGWHEVVAGEQRARAAGLAGLKSVPAVVRGMSDLEAFQAGLVENLQRKDLSGYEVALALRRALNEFKDQFPNQATLALSFGKQQSWVSEHLAILDLEGEYRPVDIQKITAKQAQEIRRLPPEKREELIREAAESGRFPPSREIEARAKPLPEMGVEDAIQGEGEDVGERREASMEDIVGEALRIASGQPEARKPETKAKELDLHATDKFCPICNRQISSSLYERLKKQWNEKLGDLFK